MYFMIKVLNDLVSANVKADVKMLIDDLSKLSTDEILDRLVRICEKYGSNLFQIKRTDSGNININFNLSQNEAKFILLEIYNNL